jgi:predicted nucleic acid-binding Zn ribbon protein
MKPLFQQSTEPILQSLVNKLTKIKPIQQIWGSAVPEPLASHSRPVHIDNDQLTVWVDAPVWAHMARHSEAVLLGGLRRCGVDYVNSLRVRVTPLGSEQPPPLDNDTRQPPPPKISRLLDSAASSIEDDELRAALLRLRDRLARG